MWKKWLYALFERLIKVCRWDLALKYPSSIERYRPTPPSVCLYMHIAYASHPGMGNTLIVTLPLSQNRHPSSPFLSSFALSCVHMTIHRWLSSHVHQAL